MNATIEARRANWRWLLPGSTVWAPHGEHWRAATVSGLGKNRGDATIVHLVFETGGKGQRDAHQLSWCKPELKGRDKPAQRISEELK